ncbi:restriction endonuclease subunit S [Candidatus Endomicrobiellum trichonymphae]|uniref:Type I restriction-modification system, substrate-binding subunit n=1 Tax=Endomicrobium trichonymphae TaxID=1408204 RepID=B1GZJ6_ENDTX|nr:restriction endonuclease subunit S [Candidatus Endomicrobium trichonymphae]BAG13678.1 type I restriction-modification system, substrate-binding subunit [Candidatus Endomicrobium trichonymphae]
MRINSKREVKKLGEICEIVNGGTPKTNVREYWNGTNLWITPAEMGKREIPFVEKTVRQLSDSGLKNSSAKLLPPYSVILSSRAPIGHLVINTKPMATNQGCKGLIPSGKLFYLFLYYYLYFSVDYLDKLGTGTTFKELPTWKLKEVEIPFPLLSEQKRIVTKLDKFSENIKRLEDAARKNIQNVKDLFNSVLNETFKNKSAVVNDNRQVYKKAHWEVKKLGEICTFINGLWAGKKCPFINVYVIRNTNFTKDGKLDLSNVVNLSLEKKQYEKKRLEYDDIILEKSGGGPKQPVGRVVLFDIKKGNFSFSNFTSVIRIINKRYVYPKYLYNYLFYCYISGMTEVMQSHSTGIRNLNFDEYKKINIVFPSISEQKKIVARLDKLSTKTKKLEIVYQEKIDGLAELKKSVLKQTFDCG